MEFASPWDDRVFPYEFAKEHERHLEARARFQRLDAIREIYPVQAWFMEIISLLNYKPGWKIYIADWQIPNEKRTKGAMELRINMFNPNAFPDRIYTEDGNFTGLVRFGFTAQRFATAESFLDWVFYCLLQIEIHEAREFFRYSGHTVYNPHVEGAHLQPENKVQDAFEWKARLKDHMRADLGELDLKYGAGGGT